MTAGTQQPPGRPRPPAADEAERTTVVTIALMWEAKAADGLGEELLRWARERRLTPEPARRETFAAPGGRVLVITWWEGADDLDAELPELPSPDSALIARPVHRWRFRQV